MAIACDRRYTRITAVPAVSAVMVGLTSRISLGFESGQHGRDARDTGDMRLPGLVRRPMKGEEAGGAAGEAVAAAVKQESSIDQDLEDLERIQAKLGKLNP